ncbi:MogA/MoaB family molybdenum cofactor biosynthesis protein [Pseudothermotoga thermarum]|uniref:Molybdopterin adenylyltransferase n=1 Tax=Pseudothermotoga thermarum DSM 5069 TaxID=688269 RepID=F7YW46_9THEM|nr:MogA/MoaB family molybdenum cofactor biosynthesis protein [Pseudothermotoga thermarum]AEH50535.1 molybdopterin adenylyltransferase [Pseudothermotoga thermarum DSM 5069]
MIRAAVLTLSDKASKGERIDQSGGKVEELLKTIGASVSYYKILPDEEELIVKELIILCEEGYDLIVTTGGTGISPRDVTPDATLKVIEKRLYGFEIAMMLEALKATPYAMLSRAVVGTRGKTLIINLPGSPNAVEENLKVVLHVIPHAVEKLKGSTEDCDKLVKKT